MTRKTLAILAMILSAHAWYFPVEGRADVVTIDFDRFPDGTTVPSNTVITTQYSSLGVTFSSTAGGPIAFSNGEASSAPNFLVAFDPASGAGVNPIVMDLSGILASRVDVTLISVGSGTVTATAYGSDLTTVLDSISVTHGANAGNGFGNHDPITLNGIGIARVRFAIAQTGPVTDGFGIDDVRLTTRAVPEPASIVLLSLGALGLLGARYYRGRRAAA